MKVYKLHVSLTDKQKERIKQFVKEEFEITLTEEEVIEVGQSMYYLGRALSRYYSTKDKRTSNSTTAEISVKDDA